MSKWRPENWINNYKAFENEIKANPNKYLSWEFTKNNLLENPDIIFEAGATAMLEALRERGFKVDGRPIAIPNGYVGMTCVFIPDEVKTND
jgi:hypothetical protein